MAKLWMEHVMADAAAHVDFVRWVDGIRSKLMKRMSKIAINGDLHQLASVAIELAVYEEIRSVFMSEQREKTTSINRDERKETAHA